MEETNKIPSFLTEMLEKQYGKEITAKILQGYQKERCTTFRVNTIKTNTEKIKEKLKQADIEYEEVSWNANAIIIKDADENRLRALEMYENGEIYMQSLSSMLPPIILEPEEGENILDMAAAPGSKTTQIAALTNNKCMITACEFNKIRSERLKFNLEKQGVTCAYVMVTDARRLDDFFSFDKILLDAPCSGSGTIYENDVNLQKTLTPKLVEKCVQTQVALLKKAMKLLKTGKEMVYSTCSVLASENEDVLQKILQEGKAQIVPIELQNKAEIPLLPVKIPGTVCICPDERFEGFFVAKIRKI